ncbi:hypothetical protein ABPG77_001390 [Micractinium sp. CCAP 211/92]
MPRPFLSRHFLGEQASCLAAVPFPVAGAAEDGVAQSHNILALGSWSEDAQEHRLTIIDLVVGHSGDEIVRQPAVARLASFQHSGRVAAVEVADLGGGALALLAASSDGAVSRLRMQVPTQPGARPEDIQLRGEDFDGALLLPWLDAHTAAVTALAANSERRELLSAAADGSLAVTALEADDAGSSQSLYACSGAVSFSAARWNGAHSAVTGSLQGLLHVWDTRQAGRPVLQLAQPTPGAASATAPLGPPPAISCLDVHPAQHYCIATGGADGGVALWDLRAASSAGTAGAAGAAAAQQASQQQAGQGALVGCCSVATAGAAGGAAGGAVCDLRFEGASSIGSGAQRLVYCTSGGAIGLLRDVPAAAAGGSTGGGGSRPVGLPLARVLFREPTAAVRACSLGAATGPCSQLFCVTDEEGLVYAANAL